MNKCTFKLGVTQLSEILTPAFPEGHVDLGKTWTVSSTESWFNLYFALPADKTALCKSNTGNEALQKPRVAERETECTGKGSVLRTLTLLLGNENLHLHCLFFFFKFYTDRGA